MAKGQRGMSVWLLRRYFAECRCTPAIIQRYLGKISGPLLHRIDIQFELAAPPYKLDLVHAHHKERRARG
jgi:predicted ATPase with chaperone activity